MALSKHATCELIEREARKDYVCFMSAVKNPIKTQLAILNNILSLNKSSEFGNKFSFSKIEDYESFKRNVPIQNYEGLKPYIERVSMGRAQVLFSAPTLFFEETSGSSGAEKLIPYNRSLIAAFKGVVLTWIYDLFQNHCKIKEGSFYWPISPVLERHKFYNNFPIGIIQDSDYFGDTISKLLPNLLITPNRTYATAELAVWQQDTLLNLLLNEDLSFISIWSPTFLIQLIESLFTHRRAILEKLKTISPARAETVSSALENRSLFAQAVWPKLDTISCWASAGSKNFIEQLQTYFSHAWIQPKGLLSTETAVTIPICAAEYPVLALTSAFFEFKDSQENTFVCSELEVGREYEVIVTTYAGLYRYNLGDRVVLKGFLENAPLLEFIGRSSLVSDICGEKLTEAYVGTCLSKIRGFRFLAPELKPHPHYCLYLEARQYSKDQAQALVVDLDLALRANPQFKYAQDLGQLGKLEYCLVKDLLERYTKISLDRGLRCSTIKPPNLSAEANWRTVLQ